MKPLDETQNQTQPSVRPLGSIQTSISVSKRGYLELTGCLEVTYLSPDLEQLGLESIRVGASIFESLASPHQAQIKEWVGSGDGQNLDTILFDTWGNPFEAHFSRSKRRISVYLASTEPGADPGDIPPPEYLTQLLDLNADMVCTYTRQGNCFAFNSAWNSFFKSGTKKNLGQLLHVISPEISPEVEEPCECAESLLSQNSVSCWVLDADGNNHFIQWKLVGNDSLGLVYLIGIDETLAKTNVIREEKLKAEFEAQYSAVAVGITQTDLFGRYVRVNEGFCRMVGYTAQELKGMRFSDITHPEDVFSDKGQSELLVAGEIERFSMEKRYIRKDGQVIWAYITVTMTRDEHHSPKMFLSAIGDVTSRPNSDSTLVRSEEFFHSLVDPNDRTYWTADSSGVILQLSQNAGLTTGVGRYGLVANKWQEIVHPDDREKVINEWSKCVLSGTQYQCEYRVKTIGGEYRWVRSRALPHRDARGKILCWYGCSDDIQTQKITEDQLARLVEERTYELLAANEALTEARDVAQAASLAKSQFLANMSHEIRTPMNGVIGIASLLREQPLDDKCRAMVDIICKSGENLIQIIGDILDYSKLEAGRVTLDSTPTDLFELVSDVTALFQGHARSKRLEMRLEVAPATVPLVVCDQLRLRQVLSNLISNAIKFTQSGSVHISANANLIGDKLQVQIKVQDDGIGISNEAMKTIFDSFTQGDGSTQRKYGGTGLGLAISKNLVDLMGGSLSVESELARGTTMTFNLVLDLVTPPAQ